MRKFIIAAAFSALFVLPVACVTIIVNFPEAAVDNAAEQFVGKVIGDKAKDGTPPPAIEDKPVPGKSPGAALLDLLIPSASAQSANVNIQTPQIATIQARMTQRFATTLSKYCANGAIGFTRDGLVALRDAAGVPLAERAIVNSAVADENKDRQAVYHEIALANGHAEWEGQIRGTFARQWIQQARTGWYYQDASGTWKQK
ncbi:MAG: YdbL family protein [Dokdonella sp.]